MIDPDHIPVDTVPPQVHIEQVRVNGAEQMGTPAPPRPVRARASWWSNTPR